MAAPTRCCPPRGRPASLRRRLGESMDALSETGYRNLAADTRVAAPAWRYWTLSLLVAVATFSMVDKMLIAVLIDPLKRDFGLTDTQAGVLTGISFSLFFALAGIPMGIAADRLHRRNLI